MKGIWEHNWFMIPVSLFFGAGLALVSIVPYGDEILYLNGIRHEPFITIFKFFSWCGETWIWVIVGLAAALWRYRFTLLIAITGLIMPLVFILKDQAAVDRPITFYQVVNKVNALVTVPGIVLNTGQTSFPSGHTMSAFGLFSLLALIGGQKRRSWGLLAALLAIGAGLSRIFLVQHFLVDVLAGAALGMLVSGFVWWLNGTPWFQRQTWMDGRLRIFGEIKGKDG